MAAMLAKAMAPEQLVGMVLLAFRERTPTDAELDAVVALLVRDFPDDVVLVRSLVDRFRAKLPHAKRTEHELESEASGLLSLAGQV